MQRIAIIDLGSNSARLVIIRIYDNLSYHLIYTQKTSLRLSQRSDRKGNILPDAVQDTIHAVKNFAHMCELFQATKIMGVATAAMRSAKNGQEIVKRIKEASGIKFKIISGEEEAKLGYLGVVNSIDEKNALLFDLGGGSLELTLIRNRKPEHLISLPIGTTNMTEKFKTGNKMTDESFRELSAFVRQNLEASPWVKSTGLPLIGIGGTARNIAKIYQRQTQYLYSKLHNYRLSTGEFTKVFELLRNTTYIQRKKIPGLSSERADIIMAGATIIRTLLATADSKQLVISGCGLREGLFYDHYLNYLGKPNVLKNILKFSVGNLLTFALDGVTHSKRVAVMAKKMFYAWADLHHLGESELKVLNIAAILHDIGISINYYDHPTHSAYLIENSPLMGLTHREQIMAALVASWHNGVSAKHVRYKFFRDFLGEKDWLVARKLSLLLAMAENLDFTETNAVEEIFPSILPDGRPVLEIVVNAAHDIELSELQGDLNWFKKEFKLELVLQNTLVKR